MRSVALLLAALATGCASPVQPDKLDRVNPPADNCVRKRAGIDVTAGEAKTVMTCDLWYFGPTREQIERFKRNQSGAQE